MAVDNNIMIAGNLGRDPELRFSPQGSAIASFSVAVERRFQQNGEWQSKTDWFDCVLFGAAAENVASSMSKGQRVTVVGRLQSRRWETKDGDKRTTIEIVADDVSASLKWANVEIERVERHEGGQSQGQARQRSDNETDEPF